MVLRLEPLVFAVAELHHQQEEYQNYLHKEDWTIRPLLLQYHQLSRVRQLAVYRLTNPVHRNAKQHHDGIQRLHSRAHCQDLEVDDHNDQPKQHRTTQLQVTGLPRRLEHLGLKHFENDQHRDDSVEDGTA